MMKHGPKCDPIDQKTKTRHIHQYRYDMRSTTAHVYALYGCPYCASAREILKKRGIVFTESFPTASERKHLQTMYVHRTLPIIILKFGNGKKRAILGNDKLVEYFEQRDRR